MLDPFPPTLLHKNTAAMIGMEGYYLAEQHSYRLGHQLNAEDDKDDEIPDESSWVMLRDGNIQKLPQENLELRVRGRVSLEMTPTDGRKREEALPPKSSNGTLYLSNLRVSTYLNFATTKSAIFFFFFFFFLLIPTPRSFTFPRSRARPSSLLQPPYSMWATPL